MELLRGRKKIAEGKFEDLLEMAQNRDKILLYDRSFDDFFPHPNGLITRVRANSEQIFWLNDLATMLYKGFANSWASHPSGIIVRRGNRLLRNGQILLAEDNFDDWDVALDTGSITLQKGYQFFSVGTGDLLYEGEFDEWRSHRHGIVIKKGQALSLNGDMFLYNVGIGHWDSYRDGVVYTPGPLAFTIATDDRKKRWRLNESVIRWRAHPFGIMTQEGTGIFLTVDKE